jgi:hypothetical protein
MSLTLLIAIQPEKGPGIRHKRVNLPAERF